MAPHATRVQHSAEYKNRRHHHHHNHDADDEDSEESAEQHLMAHAAERSGILDPVGDERIPVVESMMLNPIEKLKRYHIFPWKLVVHTVILILLLVYTYGYSTTVSDRLRNERFGLARTFSDSDFSDNTGRSLDLVFDGMMDLVNFLQQIAERYYTVPEYSPGVFMHYTPGPNTMAPIPPLMNVRLIKDPRQMRSTPFEDDTITETLTFNLTQENNYQGIFNASFPGVSFDCVPSSPDFIPCRNNTLGGIFDRLVDGVITMQLRSVRFLLHDADASVAHWNLALRFYPVHFASYFKIEFEISSVVTEAPSLLPVVTTSLLVPVVLWHLWLRIRAFQRYHIYMKRIMPVWFTSERSREYRERHAGTSWKVFAIAVDLVCIAFITMSFVDLFISRGSMRVDLWRSLLLGFSLFGYNVLYVSYLQTSPKFYVLVKTIALAIPKLLVYYIGVVPIFVAFTLTGVAVLGPFAQDTFGTVHLAACTLFCVLNGDSLLQLFTEINQTPYMPLRVFTRIYMMSYLAYTIVCALNVMLGIVQDSYTEVSDYFQICQFDIDRANEGLDAKGATATEKRARRRANRGSDTSTDDSSSSCSTTSSDSEELDAEQLRHLARKVYKLGCRDRKAALSASKPVKKEPTTV